MTTKREQILAKIKTELTGTTGVGTRIYRNRVSALAKSETPSIVLEFITDDPTVRNGTIDISVGENGEVRINAQNVTFHADNIMKLEGKKVQVEATDEFSLQAPFAHSSGHRGNLVPLSFLDVATSGQFVGPDIISKFKTEGVAKLAGLGEKLNDVAPVLTQKLGDLGGTIGDVQGQLGGALEGIQGQLPGIQDQLTGLSDTMIPQLKDIATSPGVTNLGASLQQSVAGFNFGGGLVPKGF